MHSPKAPKCFYRFLYLELIIVTAISELITFQYSSSHRALTLTSEPDKWPNDLYIASAIPRPIQRQDVGQEQKISILALS